MTQIYLVRHGETEWNAAGRVQGWSDSNLSAKGINQAEALAKRLKDFSFSAIFTSDLTRAIKTAEILNKNAEAPIFQDQRLRERSYGEWEAQTIAEIEAKYPNAWQRYQNHQADEAVIPGGETWKDVRNRIVPLLSQVLKDYPEPEQKIVIVGHGMSLRMLVLEALCAPLECVRQIRLDNASLSRIDYQIKPARGPWGRLIFLNDTCHLPENSA